MATAMVMEPATISLQKSKQMVASNVTAVKGIGQRRVHKVVLLVFVCVLVAPIALLEAISQLPSSVASPIQVPVLTTPATFKLTKQDREELLRGQMSTTDREQLATAATRRLGNEPLDPTALWLWSLQQESQDARKALELADRISRRESTVQLELVRIKSVAGDIPASLSHLDNALTVSPAAAPPVLRAIAVGLNQPKLIALIKPYELRPWYKDLLAEAVKHAPEPQNTAQLLLQGNLSINDIPPGFVNTMIMRLVLDGDYRTAKTIAKRFTGMTDAAMSEFAPTSKTMSLDAIPLSWELMNDANVFSERTAEGISFEIEHSAQGILMTRITTFPPGEYILRQTVEASTSELDVKWTLQCQSGDGFQDVWSQRIPTVQRKQIYQTSLAVLKSCAIQRWQLSASNLSEMSRANVQLTQIQLLR